MPTFILGIVLVPIITLLTCIASTKVQDCFIVVVFLRCPIVCPCCLMLVVEEAYVVTLASFSDLY